MEIGLHSGAGLTGLRRSGRLDARARRGLRGERHAAPSPATSFAIPSGDSTAVGGTLRLRHVSR
jgi:hypothetical protein